jgi:Concanavalin A-like lectin/glucanases superfamily
MKTTSRHALLLFASAGIGFGCGGGVIDLGTGAQSSAAVQAPACIPPPANAVAWWPAEGNGSDVIGHNLSTMQAVTFGAGEVGQAFNIAGAIGAQVSVAAPNFETPNTGFTVEGWVNPSALGPCWAYQCGTIAHREASVSSRTWWFGLDDASIRFVLLLQRPNGGRADVSAPPLATVGSFQHVAASYDGNSIRLYYNGTLAKTEIVGPASFNTGDPINIGVENLAAVGNLFQFHGMIDEFSVYNRTLSDQEIATVFGAGTAGKCHPGVTTNPPDCDDENDDGEHEDGEQGHHHRTHHHSCSGEHDD